MLLDDVLLEIFDFCRKIYYDQPGRLHCKSFLVWDWCLLAHVCRRWRQVIFQSPQRLNLQIFCKDRTPVRTNLGIWPALPMVLSLSATSDDDDNAIAALEHRNRVHSVQLYGTGSELGKMTAMMQEPFPVLTHLDIHSAGEPTLVLINEFLGGSTPHLQEISLWRVAFPALPTLLLSTNDLVTLDLLELPTSGYISPERMVSCLATLSKLEMFALTYYHLSCCPDRIRPPPVTRPVLPALTKFKFQGEFEYLEDLVAQINSPRLEKIYIEYMAQPDDFQGTQLSEFIDRSVGPKLTPSKRAHVRFHFNRVEFALNCEYPQATYPAYPGNQRFAAISISPEAFDFQAPDVTFVLTQFSAALCTVVHLELEAWLVRLLTKYDYSDNPYDIEWLHLLRQFPSMQTLYVSLYLAGSVFLALENIPAELLANVLPSLRLICLERDPGQIASIRRFSDHPITVVETRKEFDERLKSYVSI